ncbi:Serine/threonine-protein kinase 40, partial [Orchesella cincta]
MSSTTVTNPQILQPPAVTKGIPMVLQKHENLQKIRAKDGPMQGGKWSCGSSKSDFTCVKGQPTIRRAGEYILGPEVGNSPIKTITSYLARKDQTDDFYIIRMLTLKASNEKDTIYDIQGKSLLHTEHSLSSLLSQETGIPKYNNIISLHHYVIKQKRLPEAEAIRIFHKVVEILDRLHKRNVVHRDIKPGSIILNRETGEVTLANFCLGQHVTGDNDLLVDRRGSPAHVSPDIVNGKPYL